MPPARAPPKRKPTYTHLNQGLKKAGSTLSGLGRAAGMALGGRRRSERLEKRAMEEEVERLENAVERHDVEAIAEYFEHGMALSNAKMMNKALLAVVRLGRLDRSKARLFFENFFEEGNERMNAFGADLYYRYLRLNGTPLGGRFAKFDAQFAELARRN